MLGRSFCTTFATWCHITMGNVGGLVCAGWQGAVNDQPRGTGVVLGDEMLQARLGLDFYVGVHGGVPS